MGEECLYESLNKSDRNKLMIIEEHVTKAFKKNTFFHPFYTLHGVDHSKAVIEKLDELTKSLMQSPKRLNCCEIFCLLAAAYLHDTGMLIKNPDDKAKVDQMLAAERVPETYQVSDLIREEHHFRSENYIKDHRKNLGISHVEAGVIGKISRGHRKENLNTEPYNDDIIGHPSVRVRLIAALLRLADELDADFRRAPVELRELLEIDMNPLDRINWIKHCCTKGIKIDEKKETGLQIITIKPHLMVPDETYGKMYIVPLVVNPIKRKLDPSSGTDYIGEILARYDIVVKLEKPSMEKEPRLEIIPPEIFEEGIYMMSTEYLNPWLSFKELKILEAAYSQGYFDVPRRITLEELAESLGMESTFLINKLRAINRQILDHFMQELRFPLKKKVTK